MVREPRKRFSPLSGFGESAVYIPLVRQVVQDTVVGQWCQFGVNCALPFIPAAPVPIFLRLLLFIFHLTLLIAAFITLNLWPGVDNEKEQSCSPWIIIDEFNNNSSYLAHEHKLIDHAQDEISPKDVQELQHKQESIEEIIPKKWLEEFHRQNQGGVDHSVNKHS